MLDLPFFGDGDAEVASRAEAFARDVVAPLADRGDRDDPIAGGRQFIALAARADLLRVFVADNRSAPSLRRVCLAREAIAARSGLADSVLAVDGLGSHPIVLAGSQELKARYLDAAVRGEAIGAFTPTEAEAGLDPAGSQRATRRDAVAYSTTGSKPRIATAVLGSFCV